MYVIKKGDRYVKDDEKETSFTRYLDRAHVWTRKGADKENSFTRDLNKAYVSRTKGHAKDLSYPDKGEVIVKVSVNRVGELVEVY